MKRILLHVCCGTCATQSIIELQQDSFTVTLFFSNSNIHPEEEYKKRLNSLKGYANMIKIPLIEDTYNPAEWFEMIKGFETASEGGDRCKLCIESRLRKTAQYAKAKGFDCFTSSLSISPHKDTELINKLGSQIAEELDINFLPKNFKKKDGFKKSILISKEHGLYRQNYCGCIYSVRK
jgi:predicted adenine nucleotide alpha hydrolase (AANH) superfamily ATPase